MSLVNWHFHIFQCQKLFLDCLTLIVQNSLNKIMTMLLQVWIRKHLHYYLDVGVVSLMYTYLINVVLSELISDENFIIGRAALLCNGAIKLFWLSSEVLKSNLACLPILKSCSLLPLAILDFWSLPLSKTFPRRPGARFSKVPNLFGWHNSLCIFKTKVFRVSKLCSYFNVYSLYNPWKDQLYRISGSEFYEWLFGLVKFSGLLRNARQGPLNITLSSIDWRLSCCAI